MNLDDYPEIKAKLEACAEGLRVLIDEFLAAEVERLLEDVGENGA